jgi:uncharacterized protein (UPF0332 family)
MAKSREDLARWSLKKAEEYLESAHSNLESKRLFPAAEEIFRAVETTLEALLYHYGVRKIEYPGSLKKFTGRLALQFLIRDNLLHRGRIDRQIHKKYLEIASDLHQAAYTQGKEFKEEDLRRNLQFAENILTKAKAQVLK